MRHLLLLASAVFFFSCSDVAAPPEDEVPKAFQEEESRGSYGIKKSYGGRGDVVNEMYDEVVDSDAGLKNLEKDIRNLSNAIRDAEAAYNNFVSNNDNYYSSAMNHVYSIKDSALKTRIRSMVEASNAQYQRSVAKHHALSNQIDWKRITLNDVHIYLKLVKTLPAIEAYQKKNLPDTKPMEDVSAGIDQLIQRTKDAAKQ